MCRLHCSTPGKSGPDDGYGYHAHAQSEHGEPRRYPIRGGSSAVLIPAALHARENASMPPGERHGRLGLLAAGRKLGLFSGSIPPAFVLSHNITMINTTSNWLCSGAFLRRPAESTRRCVDSTSRLPESLAPTMGAGAMLTRRVSMESPGVTYPRGILGRHHLCGTPCSRKREHATQRTPRPTRSPCRRPGIGFVFLLDSA